MELGRYSLTVPSEKCNSLTASVSNFLFGYLQRVPEGVALETSNNTIHHIVRKLGKIMKIMQDLQ